VHGPGKGRRNTVSAQEDETITKDERYGDLEGSLPQGYLYFWYFFLAIIKRDNTTSPRGGLLLIYRIFCCNLNFDRQLSLKSDSCNSVFMINT